MRSPRWEKRVMAEVSDDLAARRGTVFISVPARRAGIARRRLHRLAHRLHLEGYELSTVDPSRNKATGRFSVAKFERFGSK